MKNIKYLGRGIHKEKFLKSLKDGNLRLMLNVINKDNDLDVQIRNNYLNIYYKGGNIAKVNSENSIEFDMFYFYLDMKNRPKKVIKDDLEVVRNLKSKRDLLIRKFKNRDYEGYFKEAKGIMDQWLKENPKPERMEQHKFSIDNQYNQSDYTIIDLEYQVSTLSDFACTFIPKGKDKPKKPRFDIIAINKKGELCVIELKKGIGSLGNTSGLKEHWDCYQQSIGSNYQSFMNEMKKLLEQKQVFNLIDKRVKIECQMPKFMFAYAYDEKKSIDEQDDKFQKEYSSINKSIHIIKSLFNRNTNKRY
ncbi:MAG: hypothetical protein U9R54_06420 [Bacteroidota bacterium]|nr:hypothetical protein [Bacteroidota bacterium]